MVLNMVDMHKVFEHYYKNSGVSYTYSDENGLTIHHERMPTEQEIADAIKSYEEYVQSTEYIRLRTSEYPPIDKQLDMLYDLGYEGWKSEIKKIKDKYPKS